MSQFQSPPPPPTAAGAYAPSGPAPYSIAAIAGFVLSFFGCTIIGALFGVILGVVGIVATRGGRRRGMGLAIAALPISLILGAIGALVGVGGYFAYRMVAFTNEEIPMVLGAQAGSPEAAAEHLLALCDPVTREEVGQGRAVEWIKAVREKHGTMTALQLDQQPAMAPTNPQNQFVLNLPAKFVNGPATIQIIFSEQSLLGSDFMIKSIAVDELPLRGSP